MQGAESQPGGLGGDGGTRLQRRGRGIRDGGGRREQPGRAGARPGSIGLCSGAALRGFLRGRGKAVGERAPRRGDRN